MRCRWKLTGTGVGLTKDRAEVLQRQMLELVIDHSQKEGVKIEELGEGTGFFHAVHRIFLPRFDEVTRSFQELANLVSDIQFLVMSPNCPLEFRVALQALLLREFHDMIEEDT